MVLLAQIGEWLLVSWGVWEDNEGGVEEGVVVRGGCRRVRRSLWKCRLPLFNSIARPSFDVEKKKKKKLFIQTNFHRASFPPTVLPPLLPHCFALQLTKQTLRHTELSPPNLSSSFGALLFFFLSLFCFSASNLSCNLDFAEKLWTFQRAQKQPPIKMGFVPHTVFKGV